MTESKNFLVERWAADNGYELLRSEYRMLFRGPFSGTADFKKQPVYYVQVRDKSSPLRSGWIRFGSRFWGLWSRKTEVRWEG